jgi:L-threonylcarbamoyladenylate synthase
VAPLLPKAAIFFDRDGTLIEDRGYLRSPSDVVFYRETISALQKLKDRFLLFIVTNQSGIGLGVLTPEEVEEVNRFIVKTLAQAGVTISAVYVCPHISDQGCECAKPNPDFLLKASEAFHVDLSCSYVIGDHPHDVEFALRVGARAVYVLTGHGERHASEVVSGSDVFVAKNMDEAVIWILGHSPWDEQREKIEQAARVIHRGGLVAFPTETVYGLGADTFQPLAVARIFEVKRRPHFDPLIVHVARHEDVEKLVVDVPAEAWTLANRFWPGPLTLVLQKKERVPDIVTAGLPTVAVRMPNHPLALDLIRESGSPIAAPSANLFGYLSPTTAQHVREQLGGEVDLVLDGGPCQIGVESTILSFLEEKPRLLRPGGLSLEEIESVIGPVEVSASKESRPVSPGMLPKHYAPRTPIVVDQQARGDSYRNKRVGLLSFRGPQGSLSFQHVEVLSEQGDLRQAAANLFAALRRLDASNLDLIVAEPIPETGLGLAIMDRLRRASHHEDFTRCEK